MRAIHRLLGVGVLIALTAAVPLSSAPLSSAKMMFACSTTGGTISPCTVSVTTAPNTSGLHQTFTITNSTGGFEEGGVSCGFTAPVTSCSIDLTDYELNGHTSQNEVVTFATGGSPAVGTVTVMTGGQIGLMVATVNVTSTTPVAVTPKGLAVNAVGTQTNSYVFAVKNNSGASATYNLTAPPCSGGPSACAVTAPTQITLGNGASSNVTVTYTAGAVNTTGTVRLAATNTTNSSITDTGSIVETSRVSVATTPDGRGEQMAPLSPVDQLFVVTSTRAVSTTYNLTSVCTGSLTGCWVPSTVTVPANSSANVIASYNTGVVNTSGTVTVLAAQSGDALNKDAGYVNVTVTNDGTGCAQDRVGGTGVGFRSGAKKKPRVAATTVNCNETPQIQATPGTMTTSGKTVTVLIDYCAVSVNLDYPYNVLWNGVDVTAQMNTWVPDSLAGSGFCGSTPRGPRTAQSYGTLTLKPGPNTLSATVCTDGYNVCNTQTWTYTYAPLFYVAVTPDDSVARLPAATAGSQVFVIKRLDADTALGTYNLTKSCTAAVFGATCSLSPASVNLRGGQTANATVTYTTAAGTTDGRIQVNAVLSTNSAMFDSGSKNVHSSPPGVSVTPDNVAVNAAPSAPNTAFYTVTNTGPVGSTFNFTNLCTGSVSGCAVTPAKQSIAGGASFTATIRYTAGAVPTTGMVRLYGTDSAVGTIKDSGWVNTTAATPGAIVVTNAGTGSTLERSLCLAVAAGHGAATECGDLRLAHAMPGVRTKNKARTPTLLYNSAHAHPNPTFPFVLTLPSGAPVPDSVTAALVIGGVTKATGKWTGSDFNFAAARRAVLSFDAIGDSTGVYTYTVQVKSWYGTTFYSSTVNNGEYALVNRANSNFGAGWWMAGVEQVRILGDGTLMWLDGDGSTRHYTSAGTNMWAAPKVSRPDTIKYASPYYTRYAEHGLKVIFDATGNHVYTVNRVSDTSMFKYTGHRLDTIIVAPMSAAKKFAFNYDAGTPARLMNVVAPPLGAQTRITTIATSGGRITSITEPDLTVVSFGYTPGDTNRIVTRTDRRGTIGTFTYNATKKLVKDSIDVPIVTQFRPIETVGVSPSSVDTALAYGLIDGPRTDVGDTTLFWQDAYGSPRRIRNALGADTKLDRNDPNYPALVTRMLAPNGRIGRAAYDTRGNIVSSIDSSSCNAAGCATTTYVWDTKWDFAALVRSPLGEKTRMSYNATNGNRMWQQPDSDSTYTARRVTFAYDTSRLLSSVQQPVIANPERVWYDPMGNPDSTSSPTGIKNYFYKDAIGRDTLSKSPADSVTWVLSRVWFNVGEEDSVARTWSTGHPDTITVTKTFDAEGNVLTHTSTVYPDPNSLGGMSHIFTYDHANRKLTEQPQGAAYGTDYFTYDAAGNVTTWRPRSSVGVVTTYDALNRPTKKIVPSISIGGLANYSFGANIPDDTQSFAYDVAGNMVQANNLYARITRTWNQNGTLAADTERVRASLAEDPSYPDVYGTRYGYDIEGRRVWVKYPSAVAASGYDSAAYVYDALTGVLRTVRDPRGHTFGFGYDNAMRLVRDSSLTEVGQNPMVNVRTYDDESRVTTQTMTQSAVTLYTSTVTYNTRGNILSATFSVGGSGAAYMKYHPLGPLLAAGDFSTYFNDSSAVDALGNTSTKYHGGSVTEITSMLYESGSAILDRSVTQKGLGSLTPDTTATTYDAAGSAWQTTVLKYAHDSICGNCPTAEKLYARSVTKMRYGNDLKLMLSITHMDTVDEWTHGVKNISTYEEREEYRYDALGRRIWKRLVRPTTYCPLMDKASGCLSMVERTIWDGDQVLAEVRADGGEGVAGSQMDCDGGGGCQRARPYLEGVALYTLGGGLDHPLDIYRSAYSDVIVPVYSWRGRAVTGVCVNNSQFCNTDFTWPARTENAQFDDPPVTDPVYGGPVAWGGNIIDTQKDGSGLIYKRNRYYDPASGRFTQVDPIGLGGGLSAYGFGGGDQVSYTDPYGTDCQGKGLATLMYLCSFFSNMSSPAAPGPGPAPSVVEPASGLATSAEGTGEGITGEMLKSWGELDGAADAAIEGMEQVENIGKGGLGIGAAAQAAKGATSAGEVVEGGAALVRGLAAAADVVLSVSALALGLVALGLAAYAPALGAQ